MKHCAQNTPTPFALLIPPNLNNPEFIAAWVEWVDERKQRGHPLTERAAIMQLNKCSMWNTVNAIASIQISIECGWTGLFAPKHQSVTGSKTLMDKELDAMERKIIRL